MRLSNYFLPTLREIPREAELASHRLMLRSGLIRQESAGIYSWLPLGCAVLRKIERIIKEEQERIGFVEMLMPTIQSASLWQASGRYDSYGQEMLRMKDRHDREMLYGPTNEEMITDLFGGFLRSYRDLPKRVYHVQWKFRDEIRPRFGVMRGREFLMKDAYSVDIDSTSALRSYYLQFIAYLRSFDRLGLKVIPVMADTGPIGGDMSHEFILLAETGENQIFCDRGLVEQKAPPDDICGDDLERIVRGWTGKYGATEDKHDPARFEREVMKERRVSLKGIEVGHSFYFGTKYSDPMNFFLQTKSGARVPAHMGSYGIGISRLVAAIIEVSHDHAGIVWPESVAPFQIGIVNIKQGDTATDTISERVYEHLRRKEVSVLYDDSDERAGTKFNRMDLIGIPWQCIVGPKVAVDDKVELKRRGTDFREIMSLDEMVGRFGCH